MSLQEIESAIKSCILSKKGDMTLSALRKEYLELVGDDIPFKRYGYECLEDFLRNVSDIYLFKNPIGLTIVSATSKKAAHIADLVSRQKNATSKSFKKRRVSYSPRKYSQISKSKSSRYGGNFVSSKQKSKTSTVNKFTESNGVLGLHSVTQVVPISRKGQLGNTSRRISFTQIRYFPNGEDGIEENSFSTSASTSEGPCRVNFLSSDQECLLSEDSMVQQNMSQHDLPLIEVSSSVVDKILHNKSPPQKTFSHLKLNSDEDEQATIFSEISEANHLISRRESYLSGSDFCESSSHSEDTDYYRSVHVTGTSLKCVISTRPSGEDSCSEDSGNCNYYSSWDYGPVMLGFHLVGDDFLLQFAYESLKVDCEWEDEDGLSCGMCISGQTIHDFHMQLQHEGIIQPRVVIMLGSVDILQGNSVPQIIDDMTLLLEDIIDSSVECVVLLTLPFLVNGGLANRNVLLFNEFLESLADGDRIHVFDVHSLFSIREGHLIDSKAGFERCINYKCYERCTTNIFGYPQGVVLWNHLGRSNLYNCLLENLPGLLEDSYV